MIVWPRLIILLLSFLYLSPIFSQIGDSSNDFSKGTALFQKGNEAENLSEKLTNFKEASHLFQASDSLRQWLETHNWIFHFLNSNGEFASALNWADSILTDTFRTPKSQSEILFYGWIYMKSGEASYQLGNFEKAESHFLIGEEYLNKSNYEEAKTRNFIYGRLGAIYNRYREPEKATYYYSQYIEASEDLEEFDDVVSGYGGLAEVYANREEYKKELSMYWKSLSIDNRSLEITAGVYLNMADAYRNLDNYDSALIVLNYAIEIYSNLITREKDKKEVLFQKENLSRAFNLLGNIYRSTQKHKESKAAFFKGLEIIKPHKNDLDPTDFSDVLNGLALLEADMGDFESAFSHIQEALFYFFPEIDKTDPTSNPSSNSESKDFLAFDILKHKAHIFMEKYENEGGVENLKQALNCHEAINQLLTNSQKKYDYESSKLILAADNLMYQEQAIHIALKIYKAERDQFYLNKAYQFSEESKAMVLQEMVNEVSAWELVDLPDSIKEEEAKLRQELVAFEAIQMEFEKDFSKEEITQRNHYFFQKNEDYNQLIRQIEDNFPQYYQLKYQSRTTSLSSLQRHLSQKESIIVEYFWGEKFLHVFAVSPKEIFTHSIALDTLPLEKLVVDFIGELGNPINKSRGKNRERYQQFIDQSRQLYHTLLYPVLSKIEPAKNASLIIIPGGLLGYLPFEVLLDEAFQPEEVVNYSTLPYLIKKYAIKYDYSASMLLNYPNKTASEKLRYAGFAPGYEQSFSVGSWQLGTLFNNRKEVSVAAKIFGGDPFLNEKATKDLFIEKTQDYSILHLAMHALMNDEYPRKSGLAFFQEEESVGRFTDSLRAIRDIYSKNFLHTFEIYSLRMKTDLVVLSACNTGVGKLARGEGIMSLARAFFYAGCPSLVMSLWQVDDAKTRVLMESFFTNLKAGHDKDEALRQAKLSFLKNNDENHPFYWASFVQTGNDAPFSSGTNWHHYLIASLFFLLIIWGVKRKLS